MAHQIFGIPDIIYEIIDKIDDPETFQNCLLISKDWANEGHRLLRKKSREFTEISEFTDNKGRKHVCNVLPDGRMTGEEEVYQDNELYLSQTWRHGRLFGDIFFFDDKSRIIGSIPIKDGLRHGDAYYHTNGKLIKTIWKEGNIILSETFDAHNQLIGKLVYTSEKNYIKYKKDFMGNMINQGLFINGKPHGLIKD